MNKIRFASSLILIGLLLSLVLSGCSNLSTNGETVQKTTLAETVFEVTLAEPLNENEILYFELLDEVTGVALNPTRYEMQAKDAYSYYVRIPMVIGSVVKYRYVRQGTDSNIIEHDTNGNTVHYRLDVIKKPAVVKDFVAKWDAGNYTGQTGEVSGYIYDNKNETPLSEILVSINGIRTFTSADGYYELKNVPLGEYNLVAIHPDGRFQTFQQGAVIAENSVTPASFGMQAADMVAVTFVVTPPESEQTLGTMRLISNLYSLGNTYSEKAGGVSVLAAQAPVLDRQENGDYSVTVDIPEGFDLQYKFSLGDGFINAEHAADGSYRVRQLIVPGKDSKIYNSVESWFSQGSQPVLVNVTVPQYTPENDVVAIQFNPFVWMEPLPMVQEGDYSWSFALYSPQEYLNNAQFRFCRNYQCGLADDAQTSGANANGFVLNLDDASMYTIDYNLETWAGLAAADYALQPVGIPTNNIYIKGIEITPTFDKKDMSTYQWGLVNAAVSGANLLVLSPTWTFREYAGKGITLQTGSDLLFSDYDTMDAFINETGETIGMYPQPRFDTATADYWANAERSFNWWQDWFVRYQRFILNYADYAETHGIQTLIIGGSEVAPAFPNGKLANGNSSNVPYDAADKWSALIDEVRNHFSGQLFFALPYSNNLDEAPQFLSKVDAIYVEMSTALTASNSPTLDELKSRSSAVLDGSVYNLYATYQKPVIIALDYPSLDGSASNCLNYSNSCQEFLQTTETPLKYVDQQEQAMVYQALIEESMRRTWIYGLVAQGYNPAVQVVDNSSSIYGKSAEAVLSYYFNALGQ
ncbi:MAG: hypothetical protein PWQ55_449 [Chloroflexota bacterium]|nr:hypothetical protein [Chloroflexota bacterium]